MLSPPKHFDLWGMTLKNQSAFTLQSQITFNSLCTNLGHTSNNNFPVGSSPSVPHFTLSHCIHQPVLARKNTPIYIFVVKRCFFLMVVVIITAEEEEVKWNCIMERPGHIGRRAGVDGWVKQTQDFHLWDRCSCPVRHKKSVILTYKCS